MSTAMRAEQAVAQAFARASDTAEAYVLVLRAIVESLGWQLGAAWEPLPADEHTVRCVAVWAVPGERTAAFAQVTRTTELRSGEGLPGRVWRNGRTAWITDFATDDRLPRREAAAAAGLHAAFAFPLRSERGVIGVIEFFSSGAKEPDEQLLGTMEVLGMQMGQLVERRRAEESQYSIEQRHQATLEAALDCVVTMDDTGRVIEFNPAACRVFGFTQDQAIGREMAELIVPERLRERHRAGLARYLGGEAPRILDRRIEIEAVRADGTEFPVELTITRIDVPGPAVFTGHLRDITDRRRAEAELRASRARIVEAGDAARRRIERDLHDGAQQQLVSVAMQLRLARERLDAGRPDEARELLDEATTDLGTAVAELRELTRGIHPAILTEGGLEPALGGLARRSAVAARVTAVPQERLPAPVEAAAYFVVAEGLTNAARHADAELVEIAVTRGDGRLVVEVRDNGRGGADASGGGLRGLADRLAALDGELDVRSDATGTTLHAEVPCTS